MSKKPLSWSTPKSVQLRESKVGSTTSIPSKLNRSTTKYCKKLKGPHDWRQAVDPRTKWPWLGEDSAFTLDRCVSCGRERSDVDLDRWFQLHAEAR